MLFGNKRIPYQLIEIASGQSSCGSEKDRRCGGEGKTSAQHLSLARSFALSLGMEFQNRRSNNMDVE